MSNRNIRIEDGFIKDDWAQQCEPFQAPYRFLFTGRQPELGMRTETQVTAGGGNWCRLSGIVTHIGEEPTFDQWVTTSSLAPPLQACGCNPDPYASLSPDIVMGFEPNCPYPDCTMCLLRKGDTEMTIGTLMNRIKQEFGAVQNQAITIFGYLNSDFHYQQKRLPFSSGRIYKVIHKVDETKVCVWQVASIQDVTDSPVSELPQVFRDWTLGRENADVAPFNLTDEERKQWTERLEEEMKQASDDEDASESSSGSSSSSSSDSSNDDASCNDEQDGGGRRPPTSEEHGHV